MSKRDRKPPLAAVPYETFADALGKPVGSVEVQRVIAALGGYRIRTYRPSVNTYDHDHARSVAWDFPSAPPANRAVATHLGIRDDTVVWMTLAAAIVDGATSDKAVFLRVAEVDEEIFRPTGAEWNWAPAIVRRGAGYLLHLDVPQGHWDGNYKFPLTPRQAELLQADPLLYREVWEGLVRICQSGRFLRDPATLPGDAQSLINARCGRD